MTVKITKPEINVREKLIELSKPSGIAGEAMLRADTPQEQFNLIGAGRRNILINGDFQVSQRGDYTTASSATQSYFVDRWYTDVGSVAYNREQTTGIDLYGTPAISKGVKLTATASGTSYMGIRQKIENPTQYVGRTITYSGYVKSNNPNARLITFTQGTTQVASSNGHSGSGKWEKLSVTFTMTGNPSTAWYVDAFISTSGLSNVAISSGDYLEVTMLQLELGKVATPFEHRSYGEELALCQRYYERITGPTPWFVAHGYGTEVYCNIPFNTSKRNGTGTIYYSNSGSPASMVTMYGNVASSGGPDSLITGVASSTVNAHSISFYFIMSANTYTPHGTSVMFTFDTGNWIAYDNEL